MKRLCVFCGSSFGKNSIYATAAKQLVKTLYDRKLELVYGGANIGIMGVLADEMLSLGGHVIGVIPEVILGKEMAHTNLSVLHTVKNMHERKALLNDLSDGFIMLPGGIGSLDEFFEIFTLGHLGIHQKPIGMFNVNNYFDGLLDFLDHQVNHGFLKQNSREMIIVENDPIKLIDRYIKK